MKIRSGFVSNSSSSSFCILGIKMPLDVDEMDGDVVSTEWGIGDYYDMTFVGACPEQMTDDETLAQFKQRVSDDINKTAKKVHEEEELEGEFEDVCTPSDLRWYTDGGYEG